jgi:hypothetical protein
VLFSRLDDQTRPRQKGYGASVDHEGKRAPDAVEDLGRINVGMGRGNRPRFEDYLAYVAKAPHAFGHEELLFELRVVGDRLFFSLLKFSAINDGEF